MGGSEAATQGVYHNVYTHAQSNHTDGSVTNGRARLPEGSPAELEASSLGGHPPSARTSALSDLMRASVRGR